MASGFLSILTARWSAQHDFPRCNAALAYEPAVVNRRQLLDRRFDLAGLRVIGARKSHQSLG
jgi:hypothetical protein